MKLRSAVCADEANFERALKRAADLAPILAANGAAACMPQLPNRRAV